MIYDHDNRPLLTTSMTIVSDETLQFKIEIDCKAGYFLRSTVVADLLVQGRHHGTGGAFTNLESSQIDLSPFDGDIEEFDIRITAGTITAIDKRAFQLIVSP